MFSQYKALIKPFRGALSYLANYSEYLGLILVSSILRAMSLDRASAFMGTSWRVIAPLTKRHERARQHLQTAFPELSKQQQDTILLQMWENLGRVAAETLLLDQLIAQPERATIIDQNVLDNATSKSKACVYVTLHAGNWEVAGLRTDAIGNGIAGVYQALSNKRSEDFLMRRRLPLYKYGLFQKSHSTGPKLMSVLKQGGSVAFVADVRDKRGVQIKFMGNEATATHIPALLARAFKVPLVAIYAQRTNGSHFNIRAQEIPVSITKNRTQDALVTTQAIHDCFENWIKEDPGAWMWIMRKWFT
ncbi:lysophospholipid acyltransferase family protein [Polycladidibacter stylochi]|uniref:lysophospholipid acyltransferase family protein n=1 Tax=Polycladidibacter stylochi TaxID=1807766 RepID=UPI00082D4045|nr:hypothetical protein [Pseudovibrio stylochi]